MAEAIRHREQFHLKFPKKIVNNSTKLQEEKQEQQDRQKQRCWSCADQALQEQEQEQRQQ